MDAQTDPKQCFSAMLATATIINTILRNINTLEDPKEIAKAAWLLLTHVEVAQNQYYQLNRLAMSEDSPHKLSKPELLPKELQQKLGLDSVLLKPATREVNTVKEEFKKIDSENLDRMRNKQQAMEENPTKAAVPEVLSKKGERMGVHTLVLAAMTQHALTCPTVAGKI